MEEAEDRYQSCNQWFNQADLFTKAQQKFPTGEAGPWAPEINTGSLWYPIPEIWEHHICLISDLTSCVVDSLWFVSLLKKKLKFNAVFSCVWVLPENSQLEKEMEAWFVASCLGILIYVADILIEKSKEKFGYILGNQHQSCTGHPKNKNIPMLLFFYIFIASVNMPK